MKHSQKIDKLLEDKGWSMAELARRASVGREQARRLAIRIPPSVLAAIRIARVLGANADWLFDDKRAWAERGLSAGEIPATAREPVDIVVLRRELRKLLGLPGATR